MPHRRTRPPHDDPPSPSTGPLVAAAAIGHETWKLAVAQLGGTELARAERGHRRDPDQVLGELKRAFASVRKRYGQRVRVAAVAVPGTVVDDHLAQAANLGWDDIDLEPALAAPSETVEPFWPVTTPALPP